MILIEGAAHDENYGHEAGCTTSGSEGQETCPRCHLRYGRLPATAPSILSDCVHGRQLLAPLRHLRHGVALGLSWYPDIVLWRFGRGRVPPIVLLRRVWYGVYLPGAVVSRWQTIIAIHTTKVFLTLCNTLHLGLHCNTKLPILLCLIRQFIKN